jgi:hypothetical protein
MKSDSDGRHSDPVGDTDVHNDSRTLYTTMVPIAVRQMHYLVWAGEERHGRLLSMRGLQTVVASVEWHSMSR